MCVEVVGVHSSCCHRAQGIRNLPMSGLIAGFDGSKQTQRVTQSLGFLSRGIHLRNSKLRRRHLRAFVVLIEIVLEADARGT